MADLNFPTSPTLYQQYTLNGQTFVWDGKRWKFTSSSVVAINAGSAITSINNLITSEQFFNTGDQGSLFNISSSGSTHTFNIPIAGIASTGLVSTVSQSFAGQKTFTSAIIGDLIGTATTAGYAITAVYSNQSGYATTSGTADTSTYAHQAGYAITSGSSSTATTATYAHQSGYATTSGSSGLATTATYSHQSGYAITSGNAAFATTSTYAHQSGYAITSGSSNTSGLATTATYSHQSGYAITSGLATSSTSVFINNATANSNHPIVFTPISGSISGAGLSTNSTVSYNPSANYLYTSGLAITASTASTSVSTGALIVNGGVGISGNLSYNSALIGNTGVASPPTMTFIGTNGDPVKLRVLDDSTLAFSGSQGQLFSISPVLNVGYIFSVNDISGVPLIRANADATVSMAEFAGNVGIGLSNPAYKLQVLGSAGISGTTYVYNTTSSISTSTGAFTVAGGVGIGGSLYVGSASNISGVILNSGIIYGTLVGSATSSGLATTANYSHQSGYAITSGSSGLATTATYSHQSGYAITSGSSGLATTASYSHLSGFATTAGLATTANYASIANTSANINVVSASTNSSHPVLFTPTAGTASGAAVSTESTFVYNPSTDILSVSGLAVTSGTASTSPTTGALIISGGVGITGRLHVGTVKAPNYFSFAPLASFANSTNGYTFVAVQNLDPLIASWTAYKLFNNLNNYSEIRLTSSNDYFSPNRFEIINDSGDVEYRSGTGRSHYFKIGNLNSSGSSASIMCITGTQVFISPTTASTSPSTGALVVTGGVGIGGSLFVGGDLIINGTTTTINSVTLTVDDKNIELGSVSSPSDVTAEGGGITLKGATDKSINWYTGTGWSSSESFNLASGNTYKINNTAVLSASSLGTGVTNSSLTALGTVTTGVWAGTAITGLYGGTGYNSYTKGDLLVGAGSTFIKFSVGSDNYVLTASSSSATGLTWSPTAATGITSLNGLSSSIQYFSIGYSGTVPSFSSFGSTHTLNIPIAGSGVTGLINDSAQTIAGQKTFTSAIIGNLTGTATTSGFATTANYSHQSGFAITSGSSGSATTATYAHQSGYGITAGFAISSTSASIATTAYSVSVNVALTNSNHPILFTPATGTASGAALSTESTFVYNPSTDILSVSGLAITSGTVSSSPTTGALVVTGGVGISGRLMVGTSFNSAYFDSAQAAIAGSSLDGFVLTIIKNTATGTNALGYAGLLIENDGAYGAIALGSTSLNGGRLNFESGGELNLTSVQSLNIASNDLVYISSATYTSYDAGSHLFSGGHVEILPSFASTSPISGALILTGGAGIAKTSYFGQDVKIQGTTFSTSSTTGALVVTGGVGIGGSLYVNSASSISSVILNSGVITGNLTGTATTATYSHQSGYAITSGSSNTSGLATTATYSHQSGYAITSESSNTSGYATTSGFATTASYAYNSGYGITSGLATTATYAHQSGFAQTATLASTATTATNATNVILAADTTNATRRLIYSTNGIGSTSLYNTSTLFTNPSASSIGASVFTNTGSVNIRPGIDAANGVSIGNSSGASFVYFDTINGRIGINQANPLYDLHITGELSATNKSFVIDHPTKPNMTLRHGSLEGPENGVYVRGKLINKKIIELPDYWFGLVNEETITVSLTPIGKFTKMYVEKIENYKVYVNVETGIVNCHFVVYGERKDIPKLDVEY